MHQGSKHPTEEASRYQKAEDWARGILGIDPPSILHIPQIGTIYQYLDVTRRVMQG